MKKLHAIIVMTFLACACHTASAQNWAWLGASPAVFNGDDGQWYFLASVDDAIWVFPNFAGGEAAQLVPAQGPALTSLVGKTVRITISGGSTSFEFVDGSNYVETFGSTTVQGKYTYAREGNETGMLNLISDGGSNIVAVQLAYESGTTGSFSGRSTDFGETNPVSGTFSIE